MGLFDFFAKDSGKRRVENITKSFGEGFSFNENALVKGQTQVFHPKCFDDVEGIIDALRNSQPVIVYLSEVRSDTAQRVLDMLSGAVFALRGGVYKVEKGIYAFNPGGVKVNE